MRTPAARTIAVAVVSVALTAALPAAPALATLSLTTSAAPTFSASLNSGDQAPTYTVPLTAGDTSILVSAGWNLTITSTPFSFTNSGTTHALASTASKITAVTSACASSCTKNPTNSIAYPVAVPAGSGPPTAVKFYDAAANTGLGSFTITPTIQVAVPQNSYSGSYSSTLTLSIASGP